MGKFMIDALRSLPPIIAGMLLAIVCAVLRVIFDREETTLMRIILEAILCGAITLAAGSAITALGMDQNWQLFIGGTVGCLGSIKARRYAELMISSKVPMNAKSDDQSNPE